MLVASSRVDRCGEADATSEPFVLLPGAIVALLVCTLVSMEGVGEIAGRVAIAALAVGTAFVVGFGATLAVF